MCGKVYLRPSGHVAFMGSLESMPISRNSPGQCHEGGLRPSAVHDGRSAWRLVSGWFVFLIPFSRLGNIWVKLVPSRRGDRICRPGWAGFHPFPRGPDRLQRADSTLCTACRRFPPGQEPAGHHRRDDRGDHRRVSMPAGSPLRGGLHSAEPRDAA